MKTVQDENRLEGEKFRGDYIKRSMIEKSAREGNLKAQKLLATVLSSRGWGIKGDCVALLKKAELNNLYAQREGVSGLKRIFQRDLADAMKKTQSVPDSWAGRSQSLGLIRESGEYIKARKRGDLETPS